MGLFQNIANRRQVKSFIKDLKNLPPDVAARVTAKGAMALMGRAPNVKERQFIERRLGVNITKLGDYTAYLSTGTQKVWATYRACQITANVLASANFKFVELGKQGGISEVEGHEVASLLNSPNPFDSWEDIITMYAFHLKLTGNFYLLKDEVDGAGRPSYIYPLLPQFMTIVPSATEKVAYYEYKVNGKIVRYQREEVIHVKRAHPTDVHLGMGEVEPSSELHSAHIDKNTFREKFLENGAQLSGILTRTDEENFDEDEFEAAQEAWDSKYGGKKNAGKCLAPDVPVRMFDGSVKLARDVVEGDLLVGDDSKPRKVLVRNDGRSRMVRIVPRVGDVWECNDDHILVLRQPADPANGKSEDVIEMSVKEFEALSKTRRSRLQLITSHVDYPERPVEIDPRCLGLWLGDGKTGDCRLYVGEQEREVYDYWCSSWRARDGFDVTETTDKNGVHVLYVTEGGKGSKSSISHLFKEKRIPEEYFINSKMRRMELLAGLMDSDGHAAGTCYEYVTVLDGLKDDVVRLANSLGYRCRVTKRTPSRGKPFWRITIQGDTQNIPTLRKRVTKKTGKGTRKHGCCGFTIEDLGVGDWCGWTLDGDGRFLLADYTVTHNTAFLNGKWTYTRLGLTMQEMQSIEESKWNIEQIFLNHGVPLSVAGLEGAANYATARQDDINFRKNECVPLIDLFVGKMNSDAGFVKSFGENIRLDYELSGLIDIEQTTRDYRPLVELGAMTPNELRVAAGLSKVDDPYLDQFFISKNLVPIVMSGVSSGGFVEE